MLLHKRVIGAVLTFFLSVPMPGFAETAKVDPMLTLITHKGTDLTIAKRHGILKSAPAGQEPWVGTILRFQGSLSGVESLGGKIRAILGDIATVDIPLSAIHPISQLSNIVYIEAAKKLYPRLDVSAPETGAGSLRSGTPPAWTGNTGRNVIIGVVDSGIDLNHHDFKDATDKTRILFLWDQAATTGTPPSGFGYGNECTKAIIDAGGCSETDTIGHGTHVAGIAAGNGSATGNGKAAFRYIGMAPEADLIIVNSMNDNVATSNAVLDGIAYIQAKAAAIGKSSVINLSLGSDLGPHDGTSGFERALDNSSGVGKVIVGAAGNEADAKIHAGGTVVQSGDTIVGFTLPSGDPGELLDIWYAGADQMGISVSNGTCTTPVVNPGASLFSSQTACGLIQILSSGVNPLNNDREIIVGLTDGTSPLATGAWSFTLSGISITQGRFDGWFQFAGDPANNVQFTTHIDPTITLVDSGTATKPISVAAYNTKKSWDSLSGSWIAPSIVLGDIASFSSRGPKRPCSDATKCPPIQKPEVAAPGSLIMSAFSANTSLSIPDFRDPDGVHIPHEGTSMSAPHLTGAVALLLQAAPTLTSDQIKSLLTSNTKPADSFTGMLPNTTWGFGKLDLQAAFAATPNPPPAAPTGLSATVGDGFVTLRWTANTEPDLDGYNLYRSLTSGTGYAKVTSISYSNASFTDTGLTNGTTYYHMLRAVDTAGTESGDSTETVGAPAVSSSGVKNSSSHGGCGRIQFTDDDRPGSGTVAGDYWVLFFMLLFLCIRRNLRQGSKIAADQKSGLRLR